MDSKQARAFEAFVAGSGDGLLRMATLLTSDPGLGEDVYQETLHRLSMRWSRVGNPAAFCRRVMHNIVIDRFRAQQRRPRETGLFDGHDSSDPRAGDPTAAVELRPALLAALGTLTTQQRAIVVLNGGHRTVIAQPDTDSTQSGPCPVISPRADDARPASRSYPTGISLSHRGSGVWAGNDDKGRTT